MTDVRVTPDLRIAKIYFSVFGNAEVRERTMEMLEVGAAAHPRHPGRQLRLRFMPELHFYLDDTLDRVDRINTLIKKIHDDRPDDRTPE